VDVLTKEYQGRFYFFTVSNELKPVSIRFMLPSGIKASEVYTYEEQQKIIVQDGTFEDNLEELGVRIYVVQPYVR
jgi:hypothetical protein